jgi:hypothetical protein
MKNLSMHIMDIFQNSIRANATLISLDIEEDNQQKLLRLTFTDNGDGMTDEMVDRVTDPFVTTRKTRKVGLGIPLLMQNAERTGGSLRVSSTPNQGTTVVAEFFSDHIDMPSLGDVAGAVLLTATSHPEKEFLYRHTINLKTYCFSTIEVKNVLGKLPINSPEIYSYLHEMISENLKEISAN